jgi:hypothetical protein
VPVHSIFGNGGLSDLISRMRKVEEVHSDMGSGAGIADVSDTQVEGRTACNRVEI